MESPRSGSPRKGSGAAADAPVSGATSVVTPAIVPALTEHRVRIVSCGAEHTACLTETGLLFTFGAGLGQLGHAFEAAAHTPRVISSLKDRRIVSVACGSMHSAAVDASGVLYMWGRGVNGQLGLGDAINHQPSPAAVEDMPDKSQSVACGMAHTLAVTMGSGDVYSWGWGRGGQLGHGPSEETVRRPKLVEALRGKKVRQVVAGVNFSACLTESGQIYFWGTATLDNANTPQNGSTSTNSVLPTPQLVDTLNSKGIVQIAAGGHHLLALTHSGDVYAWGSGVRGQLGLADRRSRHSPHLVKALVGHSVCQVACGLAHSAAVTDTGDVYTWGASCGAGNRDGLVPRPVPDLGKRGIKYVACGWSHCAAVTYAGALYTWGSESEHGMLGQLSAAPLSDADAADKSGKRKELTPMMPSVAVQPPSSGGGGGLTPKAAVLARVARSRIASASATATSAAGGSYSAPPKTRRMPMLSGSSQEKAAAAVTDATTPQTFREHFEMTDAHHEVETLSKKLRDAQSATKRSNSIVRKLRSEVKQLREVVDSRSNQSTAAKFGSPATPHRIGSTAPASVSTSTPTSDSQLREQVSSLQMQIAQLQTMMMMGTIAPNSQPQMMMHMRSPSGLSFSGGATRASSAYGGSNAAGFSRNMPMTMSQDELAGLASGGASGGENGSSDLEETYLLSPSSNSVGGAPFYHSQQQYSSPPRPPSSSAYAAGRAPSALSGNSTTSPRWPRPSSSSSSRTGASMMMSTLPPSSQHEQTAVGPSTFPHIMPEDGVPEYGGEQQDNRPTTQQTSPMQHGGDSEAGEWERIMRRVHDVTAHRGTVRPRSNMSVSNGNGMAMASPSSGGSAFAGGSPGAEGAAMSPDNVGGGSGNVGRSPGPGTTTGRRVVEPVEDGLDVDKIMEEDLERQHELEKANKVVKQNPATTSTEPSTPASPLSAGAASPGATQSPSTRPSSAASRWNKVRLAAKSVSAFRRAGALHKAAQADKPRLIASLVDRGLNCNESDEEGKTPLHLACQNNAFASAQMLVERGLADVNAKDDLQRTPLHLSAAVASAELCVLLLSHGAKVQAKDSTGATALHYAALSGSVEVIRVLMEHESHVDDKDDLGRTPLHLAVHSGAYDAARVLIDEFEGSVSSKDAAGCTPAHYAASSGDVRCLELLVDRGGAVSAEDTKGAQPLHFAAGEGKETTVGYLVDSAGADVFAVDKRGRTALHYASIRGSLQCLKKLVSRRAEINRRDDAGWTALHYAYREGHADVFDALMDAGADPSELYRIQRKASAPIERQMNVGGSASLAEAGQPPPPSTPKPKTLAPRSAPPSAASSSSSSSQQQQGPQGQGGKVKDDNKDKACSIM